MAFNLSLDVLAPYEPPISLWQLVENHVSQNEWQEVKQILGESLVDQSLELHTEIETLLEIWKEYREETHEQLTCQRLPEPPAARDRLKQEIMFFVESLRQKAADNGHNPDLVLKKCGSNVVSYVMADSRPSSSCSSRPMSARPKLAEDLKKDLHEREDMLTSLNMDDVVSHLRETLEDEVKMLLQDIEFLQHCLDDEADFRSQSNFGGEPSLQDLRQSRSKLEKELLSDETSFHPSIKEPISKTVPSIKLKGACSLPHPNQTIQCKNKPSPMRAAHVLPAHLKTKGTGYAVYSSWINNPSGYSLTQIQAMITQLKAPIKGMGN
ncbi:hypothetical protein CAPTEDRAFT_207807 [Capitella teleta]|uniref:Uncharacterized protein n=1 Tax=Capitella teleta TaxID=283909 RepID=R7U4P8_CAPTE|nr:hypothetical protein CAPTEDRAFT_207807 [Capitella teleta]|eukprot:ELT98140.1 hypothetical protein CAPTEDRAFT_207807 [Capitella teleta]